VKLRRLSTTERGFEAKLAALTRYEAAADAAETPAEPVGMAAIETES